MPTVYARNGQRVGLPAKHLAGGAGGEGMVYEVLNDATRCAKLYHAHKLDDERRRKIAHLVANPPALLANAAFRLCWPTDTLHDAQGRIVGFLMPRAFPGSVLLYELATTGVRKKLGAMWATKFDRASQAGRAARLKVCANVCIAVHCLHTSKAYLLVDFKPQNVMVSPSGEISLIDLDAVQVVSADGSALFHAQVITPEYAPAHPASFGVATGQVHTSWDLFGLAVVLYELWCGIHPFLTTAEGQYADCTTAESIQHGLFRFGPKESYLAQQQPPPHESFRLLPNALRQLFQRALGNARLYSADRPTAEEWAKTLNAALISGAPSVRRQTNTTTQATTPQRPPVAKPPQPTQPRQTSVLMYFRTSKLVVDPGDTFELSWEVLDVDFVRITDLGTLPAKGAHTITNTNGLGSKLYQLTYVGDTHKPVISVNLLRHPAPSTPAPKHPPVAKPTSPTSPAPRILYFLANTRIVFPGGAAELSWEVEGASSVEISGIGRLPAKGKHSLRHQGQTGLDNYQLSAGTPPVTHTVWINYQTPSPTPKPKAQPKLAPLPAPSPTPRIPVPPRAPAPPSAVTRIIHFWAVPNSALPGESVELSWEVEGASEAHISGIGSVSAKGARVVAHPGKEVTQEFLLSAGLPTVSRSAKVNFLMPIIASVPVVSPPPVAKPSLPLPPKMPDPVPAHVGGSPPPVPVPWFPPSTAAKTPLPPPTPVSPVKKIFPRWAGWAMSAFLTYKIASALNGYISKQSTRPNVAVQYSAAENLKQGLDLIKQEKYDDAFLFKSELASDTSQSRDGQFFLGKMYLEGAGVAVNLDSALKYFSLALDATDPETLVWSRFGMAKCYQQYPVGRQMAMVQDSIDLLEYRTNFNFLLAGYIGDAVTSRAIGDAYRLWIGSKPNQVRAIGWYKNAGLSDQTIDSLFAPANISNYTPHMTADNPKINYRNAEYLSIKQVSQVGSYTKVVFQALTPSTDTTTQSIYLSRPGADDALRIYCYGREYQLRQVKGIGTSKSQSSCLPGVPYVFEAYFERIPDNAQDIYFDEGEKGEWKLYGVEVNF